VHVSAMSRNFVSDPHSVVKSGDVVRVKVLSVDIPRHRISLTLRLDDEGPRQAGGRPRAEDRPSGTSGRTGRGSSPRSGASGSGSSGTGRPEPKAPDGALADALRRAGLAPKTPKTPKAPRAPEAPKAPKTPKAPKAPRAPEAPKTPDDRPGRR
jgi:protein Tex